MATNWGIQTSSKASTTDDWDIQTSSRRGKVRADNWTIWDSGSLSSPSWFEWTQDNWSVLSTSSWSTVGQEITWTISAGATTRDND